MNPGRKREKKFKGGLAIAKGRFVLSVTIPLLLYESLGIFVLGWAFVLMFFDYSSGKLGIHFRVNDFSFPVKRTGTIIQHVK